MNRLFIALFLFYFQLSNLSAQFPNVLISNFNDPEEVSICINPKNPQQVVAGANIDNLFYSADGGQTWTVDILEDPVNGVWGDPEIFTDTAGNFYFSHLANPPQNGNWVDRIVFSKSTDGGLTWGAGTYTGLNGAKVQDKEQAIVNPANNEIYVTWTQFDNYESTAAGDSSIILFSKSTDSGQTWSIPQRICSQAGDCLDSDYTVEGATPAVGPNGEIYVVWAWGFGLYFNKSLDGGNTCLPYETFITSMPGGWNYNITGLFRSNGLPVTLCDNNGTIYVNWTDQRNGSTDTDVWLIKSEDGGNSWSVPVRVNDDAPGKQQFLTWMDIDPVNGNIYCVFYDRRNYNSSDSTDVYLARSGDGGNSFINYKVNAEAFLPDSEIFFGDYTGISVYNNKVLPMWMAYNNDTLSVWTALIDAEPMGIENSGAATFVPANLEQNAPNPFNETTQISFNLERGGFVSLYLYDVTGKIIASLYEAELFHKGKYEYIFNAKAAQLNPGVYYYSLQYDEQWITRKMVVY